MEFFSNKKKIVSARDEKHQLWQGKIGALQFAEQTRRRYLFDMDHDSTNQRYDSTGMRPDSTDQRPDLTGMRPDLTDQRPDLTEMRPDLVDHAAAPFSQKEPAIAIVPSLQLPNASPLKAKKAARNEQPF
ncbi:MAG: hypothetical protein JSS79_19755 [Bacteroidetes bacterium]|nr:hypothetical protein [Bacteroidota bacterium]